MAKAKSKKECVYMPGMSEALKKGKVPLSPAVKANGFVFVSGLPPLDTKPANLLPAISASRPENPCRTCATLSRPRGRRWTRWSR